MPQQFTGFQLLYQDRANSDPKMFEILKKIEFCLQYLYNAVNQNENSLLHRGVIPKINTDAGLSESQLKDDGTNLFINNVPAASGTIIIPKLTGGGANGSIQVTEGLITAFVNPT
jgi:hypothetical protein